MEVPQGSILEPLLFSIYTPNFPSADDTQLYFSFKPEEQFLSNYSYEIKMNDFVLKFSDQIKNLGLWIDKELRVSDHI